MSPLRRATRTHSARRRRATRPAAPLLAVGLLAGIAVAPAPAGAAGDAERGRLVFAASGGCTCHTDYPGEGDEAAWLAGGRALATPFGTYYSTNITPDERTGIGRFDESDFLRAMQEGLAPDGSHYFPVFPYTSFTRMSDADLRDLYAYLRTVPAAPRVDRPPDVAPPFGWRFVMGVWKWMHFEPGRFKVRAGESPEWNRGAYLVNGPAHCAECHTPRTATGGVDRSLWLAGSADGPEGELAPNITPHDETGIGQWTVPDIVWYLETGFKPDGDDTQGLMAELIEHGYADLPRADREAIAIYLKSLPPIDHSVKIAD